jgi:pyruvate-formate lyase-activating enzyme
MTAPRKDASGGPSSDLGLGSLVYLAAQPHMPGVIVDIANEGITVLWVTNTLTLVPPAELRDFDRFRGDLEKVAEDLHERITKYRGHAAALRVMAKFRRADDRP